MGRAVLVTPNGEVELVMSECNVSLHGAVVRWTRTDGEPFDYRAVVSHDRKLLPDRLVPERLAAYQVEWPCRENCEGSNYSVSVPTDSTCGPMPTSGERRVFELPPAHRFGCVGEVWLGWAKPGWCEDEMRNAQVFGYLSWWWTARKEQGSLTIEDDQVVAKYNGVTRRVKNSEAAARARQATAVIWEMESEVEERCRDGGRAVVRARRQDGWKVVIRRCSDAGGVGRLLRELVMPPDEPQGQ